ncbi:MAG TPA: MBL fold metallo-hydrolase [Acidimicrobiales bacterium]|nr:MBL fold metallo-hydrolase [Acidimicrobiales bacterium]
MTSAAHDDHHGPPLPPPHTDEVADGVFAYVQPDGTWWINNTGFVVGTSGVLCVDTCATEVRTRAFLDTVDAVAGPGRRTLVNTHHHGDHTNGNCLLPFAAIIGHEQCRRAVLDTGIMRPDGVFDPVDWGALQIAAPFVTFERRLNVHVDDLLVELHHFGTAAHTTNDVVAWIPERRVLFTGDLVFNGGTPFVLMGSVAGALMVLDRLAEYDAEVLVPGHGPPCRPEMIDTVGEYLRFVQDTATRGSAAGLSPLDAARQTDLGPYGSLTDPERIVGNLHRAYAECAGARPGDPIDVLGAFVDMVSYNGGRPLRCMA